MLEILWIIVALVFIILLCALILIALGCLFDWIFFDNAISDGLTLWRENESQNKKHPYIEITFEQFKNIYYLMQLREDETGCTFPKIDIDSFDYSIKYYIKRCKRTYITFPKLTDTILYVRWAKKELKRIECKENIKEKKKNHSKETYQSIIDVMQKEAQRHQREVDKAMDEVKGTIIDIWQNSDPLIKGDECKK